MLHERNPLLTLCRRLVALPFLSVLCRRLVALLFLSVLCRRLVALPFSSVLCTAFTGSLVKVGLRFCGVDGAPVPASNECER